MFFKSSTSNFIKEKTGIKNNTIRIEDKHDHRFSLLNQFEANEIKELEITITNKDNEKEQFTRRIRDVTRYDDYYIITWEINNLTEENTFYGALVKFSLDWCQARNEQGIQPKMSEIIGGLEICKNEWFFTQSWWTKKIAEKVMTDHFKAFTAALNNKHITIDSKGGISIISDSEHKLRADND